MSTQRFRPVTTRIRLAALAAALVCCQQWAQADSGAGQSVPDYDGGALYAANCSNCHGTYGEGDGIVTPSLSVVLQDLRYLAERNGGEFPAEFIHEIVDGRAMRAAHGPDGMPMWGAEFARGEGFDEAAEARVSAKIHALVEFLDSIQIREAP